MYYKKAEIVDTAISLGKGYHLLDLKFPEVAERAKPGQFVYLYPVRGNEFFLPRPLSILDQEQGQIIKIFFKVLGRGTETLGAFKKGQSLYVLGPLGNGFKLPVKLHKKIVLVAGGLGVPPIFFLLKYLTAEFKSMKPESSKKPLEIILIQGAKTREDLLFVKEMKELQVKLILTTEDGSEGLKGVVTDPLISILDKCGDVEEIFTCGPAGMLRKISCIGEKYKVPVQVSVEARMACGVGACMGCVIGVKKVQSTTETPSVDFVRVCRDGPVFYGSQIQWEDEPTQKAVKFLEIKEIRKGNCVSSFSSNRLEKIDEIGSSQSPEVEICGIKFKNPLIASSGTIGYGEVYASIFPPSVLGGIITKSISLNPIKGNTPYRIAELETGMLNSIGLQNPGVECFIREILPRLKDLNTKIIINIVGETVKEYVEVAERLSRETGYDALEINISCPNVEKGGMTFGARAEDAGLLVRAIRDVTDRKLIVKLTPNTNEIVEVAKSVEQAGADALSLINTVIGMKVDMKKKIPILGKIVGGYSGPGIKPVALANVFKVYRNTGLDIIGGGGVMNARDVIEFLMAGAGAVSIGTLLFVKPHSPLEILEQLKEYLEDNKITSLKSIIGSLKIPLN